MRIYARKCTVKKIDLKECNEFLKNYHKQGGCIASFCCGLFYENELVQVMSFGTDRFGHQAYNVKYQYEMYRECSKKDYYIIGGKSKLLRFFIKEKDPYNIVSYCSLEHGFDGHSYYACGFTLVRHQNTSYHYEKDGKIFSRQMFQKNQNRRLEGKKEPIQKTLESLGLPYDYTLTEKENATRNGFVRVEEKGNLVFELNLKPYKGYIYKTTNLINGKIYIGQHREDYFNEYYLGSGTLITAALRKYSRANFKVEMLQQVSMTYFDDLQKELNRLEKKYIEEFDSCNLEIGYNLLEGGQNDGSYMNSIKGTSRNGLFWWTNGTDNKLSVDCPGEGFTKGFTKDSSDLAGSKFWNNGEVNVRSKNCPGEGWMPGMVIQGIRVWNNGEITKRSVECPGEGFVLGDLESHNHDRMSGKQWWNNGEQNVISSECPGEDWVPGLLKRTQFSTADCVWWNNGVENRLCKECPGDDWVKGQIKKKSEKLDGHKGWLLWNNGKEQKRYPTCPGEGWVRGGLPMKKSNITHDMKWWNNGIKNTRSKDSPGEGWVLGKLPHKKSSLSHQRFDSAALF